MRTVKRWMLRVVLLALVGAVTARVLHTVRGGGSGDLIPAIGGDTWPPVPVKPAPSTSPPPTGA